jgi:2-methylisocitrate lyase-like PEP mutase family enzyme
MEMDLTGVPVLPYGAAMDLAEVLRRLHEQRPLVLPNVWDAASARAFEAAGFAALATSSSAVSAVLGHEDHEHAPVDEVLGAVARITSAVEVPVTADFESGFGLEPSEIVDRLVAAGAAGANLEDTDHSTGRLRPIGEQAARLAAVVEAAAGRLVLNARVDSFLRGQPDEADAIERARAYLDVGVDCTYPIGRLDDATIGRVVEGVGGPVNALFWADGPSLARLDELGVTRITFGGGLFHQVMAGVETMAAALHDG